LTVATHDGDPYGFINAEETTAFRTALTSTLLLIRRRHLRTLAVFGSGKQAYWHIRLALKLRGHDIRTINIVNRGLSLRTKAFLSSFLTVDEATKAREGWSKTKFSIMSPEYGEYDRLIKDQLRAADCIITTVPSEAPLFDHLILTSTEGRKKGRLFIAIGSYKPHMIELPVELLHQAVQRNDHRHFHRHAQEGGVVVVDTLTGCLKEAGEIIQAKLNPMQLVEVGELVMLEMQALPPPSETSSVSEHSSFNDKVENLSIDGSSPSTTTSMSSIFKREDSSASSTTRSSSLGRALSRNRDRHRRSSSTDSRKKQNDKEDEMSKWLCEGQVIYKSVGLGLMDLVIGGELIGLAMEKGIGSTIDNF
jgi:ornithine cyclodeaminase/alanine dehydrogenase-like protein (mu-crystallin family)